MEGSVRRYFYMPIWKLDEDTGSFYFSPYAEYDVPPYRIYEAPLPVFQIYPAEDSLPQCARWLGSGYDILFVEVSTIYRVDMVSSYPFASTLRVLTPQKLALIDFPGDLAAECSRATKIINQHIEEREYFINVWEVLIREV